MFLELSSLFNEPIHLHRQITRAINPWGLLYEAFQVVQVFFLGPVGEVPIRHVDSFVIFQGLLKGIPLPCSS
jgi:hypothetical protein